MLRDHGSANIVNKYGPHSGKVEPAQEWAYTKLARTAEFEQEAACQIRDLAELARELVGRGADRVLRFARKNVGSTQGECPEDLEECFGQIEKSRLRTYRKFCKI